MAARGPLDANESRVRVPINTSLISEPNQTIEITMTEMEEGIYMKPIVAASQESLILAGEQLIESHFYTMCGVVNVEEPKEVVIYIKGIDRQG